MLGSKRIYNRDKIRKAYYTRNRRKKKPMDFDQECAKTYNSYCYNSLCSTFG